MSSVLELQSLQVGSTSDLLNLALGYEPISSNQENVICTGRTSTEIWPDKLASIHI